MKNNSVHAAKVCFWIPAPYFRLRVVLLGGMGSTTSSLAGRPARTRKLRPPTTDEVTDIVEDATDPSDSAPGVTEACLRIFLTGEPSTISSSPS